MKFQKKSCTMKQKEVKNYIPKDIQNIILASKQAEIINAYFDAKIKILYIFWYIFF